MQNKNGIMKKSSQKMIVVGLAAFVAGLALAELLRNANTRKKLSQIAEEGYETALDILFPEKDVEGKNLHFGPVLPEV
jgi:hypothetical protein